MASAHSGWTVKSIVADWLELHGCDGLWTDFGGGSEVCGCGINDLMPCGSIMEINCVAACLYSDGYRPAFAARSDDPAAAQEYGHD